MRESIQFYAPSHLLVNLLRVGLLFGALATTFWFIQLWIEWERVWAVPLFRWLPPLLLTMSGLLVLYGIYGAIWQRRGWDFYRLWTMYSGFAVYGLAGCTAAGWMIDNRGPEEFTYHWSVLSGTVCTALYAALWLTFSVFVKRPDGP